MKRKKKRVLKDSVCAIIGDLLIIMFAITILGLALYEGICERQRNEQNIILKEK